MHLLDYHDSAAIATNSAFYSHRVTAVRAIAICKHKHPVMFVTQSMKMTSYVVHPQLGLKHEKQKSSVDTAAMGKSSAGVILPLELLCIQLCPHLTLLEPLRDSFLRPAIGRGTICAGEVTRSSDGVSRLGLGFETRLVTHFCGPLS